MHPFLNTIEKFTSRLIPYAIGGLFVLILFEFFIPPEDTNLLLIIKIIDLVIIAIFVVHLLFLAWRARSAKSFFKEHWLDIVAIFPFEGMFKVVNGLSQFITATEEIKVTQAVFHETLEVSKEAEHAAKAGRSLRIGTRIVRAFSKSKTVRKLKRKVKTALKL